MKRTLVTLGLLLVLARPASAQWAIDVAWAASFGSAAATTLDFTYGSAVASGALLVCFASGGHTVNGLVTGVTDSVNGSWTAVSGTGIPVSGGTLGRNTTAWYRLNSSAGTPVVTATFSATNVNRFIICGSYTGIATSSAFDVAKGHLLDNVTTGTNAVTTDATGTTAEANELAVAFAYTQNVATLTTGTNVAWTQQLNTTIGAPNYTVHVEEYNVASPATVAGTWTSNNANADSQQIVVTFKQLAAASGCSGRLTLLGVGRCE